MSENKKNSEGASAGGAPGGAAGGASGGSLEGAAAGDNYAIWLHFTPEKRDKKTNSFGLRSKSTKTRTAKNLVLYPGLEDRDSTWFSRNITG